MRKDHGNSASLRQPGLIISDDHDYLGASPDRIFNCECHGSRLVEIKCPYTLTDKTRNIASLDFLEGTDENLKLKPKGNSYFDQIQGQMGISKIKECDLVIWSERQIQIVPVEFDDKYWESLSASLDSFHSKFVYPAMVKACAAGNQDDRREVLAAVSAKTNNHPCGLCGRLLIENVCDDKDASIQCECSCKCRLWFHWKCVKYQPEPELLDEEPAWFCPKCVRECDIIM